MPRLSKKELAPASSARRTTRLIVCFPTIIGQEQMLGPELADVRAKIAVGLVQAQRGEVTDFDPDAVWEEVERRYAQQQGKRFS